MTLRSSLRLMHLVLLLLSLTLFAGCSEEPCEGPMCGPDSCRNGVWDDAETDLDCGGECGGCENGQGCVEASDCVSGVCPSEFGMCIGEFCGSGVMDGDESDVDCGGSCLGCQPGLVCADRTDCAFGVCGTTSGLCLPVTCTDGGMGEDETDVDCGGATCDKCGPEQMCQTGTDCTDSICNDNVCAYAHCDDGVQNGHETAVDCGGMDCRPCYCTNGLHDEDEDEVDVDCGPSCASCAVGQMCNDFDDCESGVCGADQRCLPSHCADFMFNETETDLDCGGPCNRCGADGQCNDGDDCQSRVCDGGLCTEPTCEDGFLNGDEEETDCGGSCPLACSCGNGAHDAGETDVDCGGACLGCADGQACEGQSDCESRICSGATCRPITCIDAMLTAGETDVDCGGDCAACTDGRMCEMASDCASGVCTGGLCALPVCDDGVRNGLEGDVDCGGECDACEDGMRCVAATDCESRICTGEMCRSPSCTDGRRNGDELGTDCGGSCDGCRPGHCDNSTQDGDEHGVDCGGSCLGCATGTSCSEGDDCLSGVCAGTCSPPTCFDGGRSDLETDIDCGGPCAPCADGSTCLADVDCQSGRCAGLCLAGPLASFVLSRDGQVGVNVEVTSHAQVGDSELASVRYDFGDGGGIRFDSQHTYAEVGMYTVTQYLRDLSGVTSSASLNVRVRPFDERFDRASQTGSVRMERDDLTVILDEQFTVGNVRSQTAIAPGSGVYYVEAEWLAVDELSAAWGLGIVDGTFDLALLMGGDTSSVSIASNGSVTYGGMYRGGRGGDGSTGVVVDYRGAHPIVHIIQAVAADGVFTLELSGISGPVYFVAGGTRTKVGPLMRINTGFDRANFPFSYNPAAVLSLAGVSAPGLVLGWTNAGTLPADAAPVVSGMAGLSMAFGDTMPLSVSATDAEDGDIAHSLRWEDLSATYNDREIFVGEQYMFRPLSMGQHRVRARVYDGAGQIGEHTIIIDVTGSLERFDTVHLVIEENTGTGTLLSDDNMRVRFIEDLKAGVRANQAIIDGFHYFEGHRHGGLNSQGVGLVTATGNLDPYDQANVPWSCSAQVLGGLWRNFIRISTWDTSQRDVGVAVDYRGVSPIIYYIVNNEVVLELPMPEITVPIHPMFYGHPPLTSGWQWEANFGESAFGNDPLAALNAHGVDTTGFTASWGR